MCLRTHTDPAPTHTDPAPTLLQVLTSRRSEARSSRAQCPCCGPAPRGVPSPQRCSRDAAAHGTDSKGQRGRIGSHPGPVEANPAPKSWCSASSASAGPIPAVSPHLGPAEPPAFRHPKNYKIIRWQFRPADGMSTAKNIPSTTNESFALWTSGSVLTV